MDWKTSLATLALAPLLSTVSANAQEQPETLSPLAGWTLNYDDDSCALVRTFGDPDAPVLLEMRQYAPGTPFIATVVRQGALIAEPRPHFQFGETDAGSAGSTAWLLTLSDDYNGARTRLHTGSPLNSGPLLDRDEARSAHERSLLTVNVSGLFDRPLVLHVGSMEQPLDGVRECLVDLVADWGIDVEALRNLSSRARLRWEASGYSSLLEDLDTDVARSVSEGMLPVRVLVGPDGRIKDCARLMPLGEDRQIRAFCEELTDRMRYEPALDAGGNPIADYDVLGISRIRTQAI